LNIETFFALVAMWLIPLAILSIIARANPALALAIIVVIAALAGVSSEF
jgi:hypothetical protein